MIVNKCVSPYYTHVKYMCRTHREKLLVMLRVLSLPFTVFPQQSHCTTVYDLTSFYTNPYCSMTSLCFKTFPLSLLLFVDPSMSFLYFPHFFPLSISFYWCLELLSLLASLLQLLSCFTCTVLLPDLSRGFMQVLSFLSFSQLASKASHTSVLLCNCDKV